MWLIPRWPILNNVPFMCPLLWSFVSSPPPFTLPLILGFPAVRQLQVSLSGTFYLQLNSAPPPVVAGSTGSTLLSTKQTVNSRFMPRGCDTSTTHSPNMFLHGAANRKKGRMCSSAAARIWKRIMYLDVRTFSCLKWHLRCFTVMHELSLMKYLHSSWILLLW